MDFAVDALIQAGVVSDVSRTEIKKAAWLFYRKLVVADSYRPDFRLASGTNVTLVRASQSTVQADLLGADYGLGSMCVEPVSVHVVDGTHETFIIDGADQVAACINASLCR